jgi:hypothetical protein
MELAALGALGLPNMIPASSPGMPLNIPYLGASGQVNPGLYAAGLGFMQGFFDGYSGPSGYSGSFRGYDVFEQTRSTGNMGTRGGRFSSVENFELGFSSVIGKKLKISADVYSYVNTGFTNFNAVGDAYELTGFKENLANDLASAVMADATPYATNAVTQATTAAYAQMGLPASGLPANFLFQGHPGVAPLADAIAGGVQQTLGGIYLGYQQGGAGFAALVPDALLAAIGTVESSIMPVDGVTHIPAGYQTNGDAKRSHFGGDVSMDYFANADLRLWANASWLSQNEWIPGEDNDDDLLNTSYLNVPKFKYKWVWTILLLGVLTYHFHSNMMISLDQFKDSGMVWLKLKT